MHRRVRGELREDAGRFPAGTPYRADDPDLLLWILACIVESSLRVYDEYVAGLSHTDRERYWADYRVVGRLFGLRRRDMPATLEDLRAYGDEMLASGRLVVTDWARTRAKRIVLDPPVPFVARPVRDTVNFITIGLLPDRIREEYGFARLPPPAVRKALVGAGAAYVKRGVLPFVPAKVRLVGSG
jgi:uncharacterized protein (DUF2236 family)